MALIGYARVSTAAQTVNLQHDALIKAGCERLFTDVGSGAATDRPELLACLDYLRSGDVLVIWRLDRLGRSLPHLLQVVEDLRQRGAGLRSLTESIDTTTSTGRMVLGIFGSLAQFERDLIRERTNAGLEAARARGRRGGRPSVMSASKARSARALLDGGTPLSEIASSLGVGRATLYRWRERERAQHKSDAA